MAKDGDNTGSPDNSRKKVRLARQHISGIIVPRWWRGNLAVIIGVIAVASVMFAAYTLNKASDRIAESPSDTRSPEPNTVGSTQRAQQVEEPEEQPPLLPKEAVAHLFPDGDETDAEEPVRAYEEALPDDLYEDAPVVVDATGPRFEVPEEYVPDAEPLGEPVAANTSSAGNGDTLNVGERSQTADTGRDKDGRDKELSSLTDENARFEADADAVSRDVNLMPFEEELLQQDTWLANAIPFFPAADNLPMIAIVIDDVGVDRRRSPRAIALPGPLTMSFLTYARELDAQTAAALDAGHELMIHVPMEPGSSTVDPGPNVLRVADNTDEILENLRWGLSQFDGYVGLNNHMGSKFTQDSTGMRAVLEEVKSRGLLFLDSRTAGGSVAAGLAAEIGVPFATRNVFLDHVEDESEVRMRLEQTERLARKNGAAIAIGHPHDATLNVLEEWLPMVADKGFVLAPMSAVVRRTWLQAQQSQ